VPPSPDKPVERTGQVVRLREPTAEDKERLEKWRNDPVMVGEFNDFGVKPGTPRATPDGIGRVVVERLADGEVIGDMSWHPVHYGPGDGSRAFNFGISLRPEARGQGYGVEAQRLLPELLFDLFDVVRVEASTDVENVPEQRALEKAGFTREGVLRQAQFRAGTHHDLIVYSVVRDEIRDA